MPKLITQADIDRVWDTYEAIHGTQPLTIAEVEAGVKKLLRAGGAKERKRVQIKFVTGRNRTHFVDLNQLNVNLEVASWRSIVWTVTWRCNQNRPASVEYKLAKRACEGNFLVGALIPVPKVMVPLSKEQIRATKIARLVARRKVWEAKQLRARTWIKKIDRSLNAYRRHAK
jgi:hypothetical protein